MKPATSGTQAVCEQELRKSLPGIKEEKGIDIQPLRSLTTGDLVGISVQEEKDVIGDQENLLKENTGACAEDFQN